MFSRIIQSLTRSASRPRQYFFAQVMMFVIWFIFSSLFANAVGVLIVGLVFQSIFTTLTVARRPLLQTPGAALIAAGLLFGLFFSGNAATVYPEEIRLLVGVSGTIIVGVLALGVALLTVYFRRFMPHLRELRLLEQQQATGAQQKIAHRKSAFAERLKDLTVIVLSAYLVSHILMPVLVPAAQAATSSQKQLTPNEFIDSYDPDKEYQSGGESIVEDPKQRMPGKQKETGTEGEESSEKEQKEPTPEELAHQKYLEMLKQMNLTPELLNQLLAEGTISPSEMGMLIEHGLHEKKFTLFEVLRYENLIAVAGAFKERYPILETIWNKAKPFIYFFFPSIGLLVDSYKLDQKHGGHVTRFVGSAYDTVMEGVSNAGEYIRENPQEAFGLTMIGIGLVGLTVVCPLCGLGLGLAATGMTVYTIHKAYQNGGVEGVLEEVFSRKTLDMITAGDFSGAAGRGLVELVGFVFENMPENPLKVMAAVGVLSKLAKLEKAADVTRLLTSLTDARQLYTKLKQLGTISDDGIKLVGLMLKEQAIKGVDELDNFIQFLSNPRSLDANYAYLGLDGSLVTSLNKQGERMKQLETLGVEIQNTKQVLGENWDGFVAMAGGSVSHSRTKIVNGVTWESKARQGPRFNTNSNYSFSLNRISKDPDVSLKKNRSLPDPTENTTLTANQLIYMEKIHAPAHPGARHAGKKEVELKNRISDPTQPNTASSFTSYEEYVDSVNEVYKNNHQEIRAFLLDSSKDRLTIKTSGNQTARGIKVDNTSTSIAKDITIVFEKNEFNEYYIITDFPK